MMAETANDAMRRRMTTIHQLEMKGRRSVGRRLRLVKSPSAAGRGGMKLPAVSRDDRMSIIPESRHAL
jgi:hypothetical protein